LNIPNTPVVKLILPNSPSDLMTWSASFLPKALWMLGRA